MTLEAILFELYCLATVLTISWSYYKFGLLGSVVQMVIGWSTILWDYVRSPTTKSNLERLDGHGYKKPLMLLIMACNLAATNALVTVICAFFGCFDEPMRKIDVPLVSSVVVNLALAEASFTAGHALLHRTRWGASYHDLHHLCQPCSWSTNLLFHPVDMAVEFAGPFVGLVLSHIFILKDPLVLGVSLHVIHAWYAFDHSENLKLYHYFHHQFVDSNYSVYVRHRFPGPEYVKPLVKATPDETKTKTKKTL